MKRTVFAAPVPWRRYRSWRLGASGASGGAAAKTLTVWLSDHAQLVGGEVAAANAQFKGSNPAGRGRPDQTWLTHHHVRRGAGGEERAGVLEIGIPRRQNTWPRAFPELSVSPSRTKHVLAGCRVG